MNYWELASALLDIPELEDIQDINDTWTRELTEIFSDRFGADPLELVNMILDKIERVPVLESDKVKVAISGINKDGERASFMAWRKEL